MKVKMVFMEIDMDVEYSYQPFEPEERSYPGCPESAQVEAITIGGQELEYDIFADNFIKALEEKILKDIDEARAERKSRCRPWFK